ncbi:MAG: L-aspartate oxidase [Myxococcota bacterium]|jgi:L-aspartate oxidase|nr:L-aspartate oxidase [Myxococcota bacterium]
MSKTSVLESEVLVLGAGVAGLSAALAMGGRQVTLLSKTAFGKGGSTPLAQGGIAAAVGADDTPSLHAADTIHAAAGLAVSEVVEVLTSEGPEQIQRLLELGTLFDRSADGELSLGREAAHSRRRILHAHGDATGAELVRVLSLATAHAPNVHIVDHCFAYDLLLDDGGICGVVATLSNGEVVQFLAPAVVIATGGVGQIFARTTNSLEATADGLAMAARAGARLADVEFVQFHPTALHRNRNPMPLLTEALRGEGAVLLNERAERFMVAEHPDAELAPRDVVARAIWRQQSAGARVVLDASRQVGERFPQRFPTVWSICQDAGLDPRREGIPVSPAAHYHMGGIDVDLQGRSSLTGLWACGEVAATGVHGANRLASNSLLEGLVFGARVGRDLESSTLRRARVTGMPSRACQRCSHEAGQTREALRELMWSSVGLLRHERGMENALMVLERMADQVSERDGELLNMILVSRLITEAALARRESRGGHYREDYPSSAEHGARHIFVAVA